MAIKSCVSADPCEKKELPFPKLMKSAKTENVVFFNKEFEGILLSPGTKCYEIGEYSKEWTMVDFKDFKGSVCLENDTIK